MYQELEMWKAQQKKKTSKIKFNDDKIASISAIAFLAVILVIITFVNQFTFVNIEKWRNIYYYQLFNK